MPTDAARNLEQPLRGTGGLLLCRAAPDAVAPAAVLLRRPMLLAPAGRGWSVLVPAGLPWQGEEEPVDLVLDGWAAALAVGAPWPVLALWWDAGRAGFSLASGVRRPVGYVWLADGTPAGEDEAMRTFAGRLGLDPVFAVQALDGLTRPDSEADGAARLRGVLAVLAHAGLALPTGLVPVRPADALAGAAWMARGVRRTDRAGWREVVRPELVEASVVGPLMRGRRARLLAAAHLAAGSALGLWGLGRRSGGWAAAGGLLAAQGIAGLAYDRFRSDRARLSVPPD
ncbi:hypothetical protein [Streptomyces albidoflavus]|uniref:hypothetical protein n=1 Tax=Streptomyces albidoflavus TaxID=1886 RepID=UPI000FF39CC6|nr:hypothetical protein [Streptomyces albidoflavus]RWZ76568.1 hypothetical protein EQK42_07655 [Streptomyces albidoflavus]